jgi:hypothetical protein
VARYQDCGLRVNRLQLLTVCLVVLAVSVQQPAHYRDSGLRVSLVQLLAVCVVAEEVAKNRLSACSVAQMGYIVPQE